MKYTKKVRQKKLHTHTKTRELQFMHPKWEESFGIPQRNGDVFAFTEIVNDTFKHGIPKTTGNVGERFSIIAWGKRNHLNERNSGCKFNT